MYGWFYNQYGQQNQYIPQNQNGQMQMQNGYGQPVPVLQPDQYGTNMNSNGNVGMNVSANGQQMTRADERIWVQNETAATAYLIAPNSFVRLWDASRPVFYEKSADASGKPQMDVYEYHRAETESKEPVIQSVSKDEYLNTMNQFDTRLRELEEILKK